MSQIFIISAPSGSGKSTLVKGLLETTPNLRFSVSYTTRAPRGAEVNGEDYYYISREEFEKRLARDEFLEHADVFGNYYGTHISEFQKAKDQGCDLVLDIDVQGAGQLKRKIPGAVSIFILAPSREILERRLRTRSEDADAVIERRLRGAAEEIRNYRLYDYIIVNDAVETSVDRLAAVVKAERSRRDRMEARIQPILESFDSTLLRS